MIGEVGILNVGAGDTKLSFDPAKPAERDRAAKTVEDMLKRGYAILVQVGERDGKPLFMRAESFDPVVCEYLIVGTPSETDSEEATSVLRESGQPRGRKGRQPVTALPAAKTRTVAVARTAGG